MLGVNLQGPGCCVAKCFHDHSQGCCPEGLNMSRQVSYITGHWPPSYLLRPSLASSICDSVTSMLIPKPLLLPDFHLVQTPAAPAEVVQLEAASFKSKSATPLGPSATSAIANGQPSPGGVADTGRGAEQIWWYGQATKLQGIHIDNVCTAFVLTEDIDIWFVIFVTCGQKDQIGNREKLGGARGRFYYPLLLFNHRM